MYEKFYGLKEKPFSLNPDPSFLYLSEKHRVALNLLNYSISSEAGITVISGEVGSGKTTLIHEILHHMEKNITVGLISNTHQTFGELLKWVLMAFDLDYEDKDKTALYQTFVEFLIAEYSANKRTILIIDEAQNLDIKTLEELRLLSNINVDKHLVLQLILAGQPELLEMLQRPELRQLVQRVLVDYHLKPLNGQETFNYIRHRLSVAGGDKNLIDPYACAAVYYHSGGIPRLINMLCDFALVYGFSDEKQRIDLPLMLDVIKDKRKGGIFPILDHNNGEANYVCAQIKKRTNIDISLSAAV